MRMKMVCDDRTLREVANEFLALKKAQKVRERTLSDYKKYIDMIAYISVDVSELRIFTLPDNCCQGTVIKYGLRYISDRNVAKLSLQYIGVINKLFEGKVTMVWKTKEEMEFFMRILGRQLHCRIHQNSVILPTQVVFQINKCSEITPTKLQEILRLEGLETEEKLRKYRL